MIASWGSWGRNVLHIWNNHFLSKRKLLLQVLVDGFLWELDEFGNYQAIMLVAEVLHEPRGVVLLSGRDLVTQPGVH